MTGQHTLSDKKVRLPRKSLGTTTKTIRSNQTRSKHLEKRKEQHIKLTTIKHTKRVRHSVLSEIWDIVQRHYAYTYRPYVRYRFIYIDISAGRMLWEKIKDPHTRCSGGGGEAVCF